MDPNYRLALSQAFTPLHCRAGVGRGQPPPIGLGALAALVVVVAFGVGETECHYVDGRILNCGENTHSPLPLRESAGFVPCCGSPRAHLHVVGMLRFTSLT